MATVNTYYRPHPTVNWRVWQLDVQDEDLKNFIKTSYHLDEDYYTVYIIKYKNGKQKFFFISSTDGKKTKNLKAIMEAAYGKA